MTSGSGDHFAGRAELLRFLEGIGQAARDELLLGLQAPAETRLSTIAESYRIGATDLGEFLEKLERDEQARVEVIAMLRSFSG